MAIRKKGMDKDVLVVLILAMAFIGILFPFQSAFAGFADDASKINQCKLSMLANSEVRGGIISRGEEKIPVKCPARSDLVIKYSDIDASSAAMKKYNIMRILADNQRVAFEKGLGAMDGISPFKKEDGIYCMIDRKVSFDQKIKDDKELHSVDNYLSYLMNTRVQGTDKYYSEILYGYRKSGSEMQSFDDVFGQYIKKQTDDEVEKQKFFASYQTPVFDLSFDTSLDYDIMHIYIKGENNIKVFTRHPTAVKSTATLCGGALLTGIGTAALSLAPDVTITKVGAFALGTTTKYLAVGCIGSLGVTKWLSSGDKIDTVRFTAIVPVESVDYLGCTETIQ